MKAWWLRKIINKPFTYYHTFFIYLVVDRQTLRSKGSPSTNAVQPKKVSLDNMSTAFDKNLSSGSHVRRVCPSCKTPRAFSCNVRSCHSCRSELVVWYRKNNTTCWTKPRMPPNQDVVGPYLQCKHFLMGKACVKTPCKFAHGDDELEIWDLLRGKSKFPVIKLYSIIKHADRHWEGKRHVRNWRAMTF
jgi:hypothetical protein